MNQKKIGEFIATCRKAKKWTQAQLAEQLGVTNKTVSRWENGNYMPDLSLLEPLSKILGVTVTDLLQGKVVSSKEYPQASEENLLSTIQWSNQKVERTYQIFSLGFILFGLLLMTSTFTVFPKESSWGSTYSIIGIVILIWGILREIKIKTKIGKVGAFFCLFLVIFSACLVGDYLSVTRQSPPLYRYMTTTQSSVIEYKTFFYNVYRIHPNTSEEYYLIDHKKEYTIDTVPISPLNMNKSEIENLLKYQNKYVGNNSNDGALISKLPLSEYGYVFQIDSQNLGLRINYPIMDWYVRESHADLYLEQSLLYNSAAIFLLIENVNYLQFDFSGVIYKVTREEMEQNFPHYRELKTGSEIQKKLFRKYVAEAITEPDFIYQYFDKLLKKDLDH